MDTIDLLQRFGTGPALVAGGAAIGLAFGFFAQRSGFCLRAAAIEFARGRPGERLSVWLLTFSTAVVATQLLVLLHATDVSTTRQLSARGSLSGAIAGGLLFGCGMVLTRGCASRLLVLSATGNLRALLSGLVFAVAAQASLGGALAPARQWLAGLWTVEGGASRDLLAVLGLPAWAGLAAGIVWMAAALWYSVRSTGSLWKWAGGIGAGAAVASAWAWTSLVARDAFEVAPVQGLTFSGPSADWLMRVLSHPAAPAGFDTGMLPGVFVGSALGAALGREFRLEGFKDGYGMRRYIAGAVLMGFGAMSAGGCAVGAGVSGGAIFALTAWLALVGMWIGAAVTDRVLDAQPAELPRP